MVELAARSLAGLLLPGRRHWVPVPNEWFLTANKKDRPLQAAISQTTLRVSTSARL